MTTPEQKPTLEDRYRAFKCYELPGQPMAAHMGTIYLVTDLYKEVTALKHEVDVTQLAFEHWRDECVDLTKERDALQSGLKETLVSMGRQADELRSERDALMAANKNAAEWFSEIKAENVALAAAAKLALDALDTAKGYTSALPEYHHSNSEVLEAIAALKKAGVK